MGLFKKRPAYADSDEELYRRRAHRKASRQYVNEHGLAVDEQGQALAGGRLPDGDSPAYRAVQNRMHTAQQECDALWARSAITREVIETYAAEFERMVAAITDAGEREDAHDRTQDQVDRLARAMRGQRSTQLRAAGRLADRAYEVSGTPRQQARELDEIIRSLRRLARQAPRMDYAAIERCRGDVETLRRRLGR